MKFQLKTEFITLQQLLKACDLIGSGGQVKAWLAENEVLVNGEPENRRGRKLYPGDIIETQGERIEME
jgi:ribosome-associated protein